MGHNDYENVYPPCRVSIEELAHDRGLQEFSAEDLKDAREEIVDAILTEPKGWKGHTLFGTLQEYLNTEPAVYDTRLAAIAKHVQHMLNGNPSDRPAPHGDLMILARADAETFFRGTVEDYIDDEWVEEHAADIAADKLEDAG